MPEEHLETEDMGKQQRQQSAAALEAFPEAVRAPGGQAERGVHWGLSRRTQP